MENRTEFQNSGFGGLGLGAGYGSSADYGIYCMSLAHQIAELRREGGESECGIKESIHAQSLMHSKEFCDTNKNVADGAVRNLIATKDATCVLDKSILESRQILAEKIDRESDLIKLQLNNFERQVAENFCQVRTEAKDNTQKILDKMSYYEDRRKDDIIDELRHDKRHLTQLSLFSNEMNSIKSMINSIEQKQEVTNKSIIFGNGSNSTKTTTNNA